VLVFSAMPSETRSEANAQSTNNNYPA